MSKRVLLGVTVLINVRLRCPQDTSAGRSLQLAAHHYLPFYFYFLLVCALARSAGASTSFALEFADELILNECIPQ